jgi:hypothetical protein
MIRIADTLDGLTTEDWQRAFGAYVTVNRSHWTGPPFDIILQILRTKGSYEFGVPGLGTWTTRFRLAVEEDGSVVASLSKNPELGPRMKASVEKMETEFLHLLTRTVRK